MSDRKTPKERREFQFEMTYLKLATKKGCAPRLRELGAAGFTHTWILRNFGTMADVYEKLRKKHPARMLGIPLKFPHDATPKKNELAKIYATKYKELHRVPSYTEAKISDKTVARLFGSQENLHNYARETFPGCFFDVSVDSVRTPKRYSQLAHDIKNKRRFFISAVGQGDVVDTEALASVSRFCEDLNAAPLGIVCFDPAARSFGTAIDKRVIDRMHLVQEDTALNDNFFISTIGVTMKQMIPLTGLQGIAQRNRSMILASPKQQLEYVPTANQSIPHALMTTGAITLPDYTTDKPMSQRTAYIATHTHVMGGLIVEIEDERIFHFRQVQFDSKGRFADLGRLWSKDGSKPYAPVARPGDWHTGCTDQRMRKIFLEEMVPVMGSKTVFLEDLFDGYSISHHERKSIIRRAIRANQGQGSLAAELHDVAMELTALSKHFDEIFVVKSNHDMFLEKYLANGWHIQDPQNTAIGSELLIASIQRQDPLRKGVEKFLPHPIAGLHWLGINDDLRVGGVFMPAHGHKGPGGTFNPPLRVLSRMYGEGAFGHNHVAGIYLGAWRTATMSERQDYEEGPSARMHAPLWIYQNGSRQLTNIIGTSWRVVD